MILHRLHNHVNVQPLSTFATWPNSKQFTPPSTWLLLQKSSWRSTTPLRLIQRGLFECLASAVNVIESAALSNNPARAGWTIRVV